MPTTADELDLTPDEEREFAGILAAGFAGAGSAPLGYTTSAPRTLDVPTVEQLVRTGGRLRAERDQADAALLGALWPLVCCRNGYSLHMGRCALWADRFGIPLNEFAETMTRLRPITHLFLLRIETYLRDHQPTGLARTG